MDSRDLTDQIMKTIDSMIGATLLHTERQNKLIIGVDSLTDPHAGIEKRVTQMREQLAALSELPRLIQERVDNVSRQIQQITHMDSFKDVHQERFIEVSKPTPIREIIHPIEKIPEEPSDTIEITEIGSPEREENFIHVEKPVEVKCRTPERAVEIRVTKPSLTEDELAIVKKEEVKRMLEEKIKMEKEKEIIHNVNIEQAPKPVLMEAQRARSQSPRPQPAFGPAPKERSLMSSGGRKWRRTHEEYDEEQIQETLTAQAEVIKGKAIGVNFMKFEKPPPPLDHLRNSEVYKIIHNMDESPVKKVANLKTVIAEADYRQIVRST